MKQRGKDGDGGTDRETTTSCCDLFPPPSFLFPLKPPWMSSSITYSRLKSSPSPPPPSTSHSQPAAPSVHNPSLAQRYAQTLREAQQHRRPPFFSRVALIIFTLLLFWMAFNMRWQVGLWKESNRDKALDNWFDEFDQVENQVWR